MYVCYFIKCLNVCLFVPPSINKDYYYYVHTNIYVYVFKCTFSRFGQKPKMLPTLDCGNHVVNVSVFIMLSKSTMTHRPKLHVKSASLKVPELYSENSAKSVYVNYSLARFVTCVWSGNCSFVSLSEMNK